MFQSLEGFKLVAQKKRYIYFLESRYFPMFDIAFVIVFHMDLKHFKKKKERREMFFTCSFLSDSNGVFFCFFFKKHLDVLLIYHI